jgi:uncharacterized protein (UPF0332 family)
MTPQAVQFIEKANELLAQADTMLRVKLYDACGRNAYLAAFHVAQAFIFEGESKIHKTYNGVRTEFGRLTKDDARLDGDLRSFLARSYNLKAVADYETGPGSHVSYESAARALEEGKLFVSTLTALIAGEPANNSSPAG